MKSLKNALIYGFLLWIIPFIISIAIFPFKTSEPFLFHSLMMILSVITVVVLSVLYFKKTEGNLREGIFLGVLFLAISLSFDYFMFIWGPIKMSVPAYIKEIGFGYLVYPIITIGYGYLPTNKK
jgi:EamA domain-containing membrane protein RarD